MSKNFFGTLINPQERINIAKGILLPSIPIKPFENDDSNKQFQSAVLSGAYVHSSIVPHVLAFA